MLDRLLANPRQSLLHPALQVLPRLHDPFHQSPKRGAEPAPDSVPGDEVDGSRSTNTSEGELPGAGQAQQAGADLEGAVDARLGRLGGDLDGDAAGVALDDGREGGGAGGDVEQLVDGAAPPVPLRVALALGVAHLLEVPGNLLALLLRDDAHGVARRPGDPAHAHLDDDVRAEDDVVLAHVLGLPLVQPDAAEGRPAVEDELAVALNRAGNLGDVCAPDDVQVVDVLRHGERGRLEVDVAADQEEQLVDLPVACGAIDLLLQGFWCCEAHCGLGWG